VFSSGVDLLGIRGKRNACSDTGDLSVFKKESFRSEYRDRSLDESLHLLTQSDGLVFSPERGLRRTMNNEQSTMNNTE